MAEKTLQNIHEIATVEFLEKGFRGASLREIVRKAGVTTGSFYGYYKSKEELFSALVKPHADYVAEYFNGLIERFRALPKKDWASQMYDFSAAGMAHIYEYAYSHRDAFRLILNASEGTEFEHFIHHIVELEISVTRQFYREIEAEGYKPFSFDPILEHMIISGEFSAFFELIVHDIPKDEGQRCVKELHGFYQAAWASVLKIR